MKSQIIKLNDRTVLCDSEFSEHLTEIVFSPEDLEKQNLLLGEASGRGAAYFINYCSLQLVLRHFRRGGLIGKIVKDLYVFRSYEHSRSWREWRLLAELYTEGLPVPKPMAASVQRYGLLYRADIVTELIPGSRTLASILSSCLPREIWIEIGRCLRRFHDAGVYHADLNAHNILLDKANRVYLIDFDRGCRKQGSAWKKVNLSRLERSLVKISGQDIKKEFTEKSWELLLQGYHL